MSKRKLEEPDPIRKRARSDDGDDKPALNAGSDSKSKSPVAKKNKKRSRGKYGKQNCAKISWDSDKEQYKLSIKVKSSKMFGGYFDDKEAAFKRLGELCKKFNVKIPRETVKVSKKRRKSQRSKKADPVEASALVKEIEERLQKAEVAKDAKEQGELRERYRKEERDRLERYRLQDKERREYSAQFRVQDAERAKKIREEDEIRERKYREEQEKQLELFAFETERHEKLLAETERLQTQGHETEDNARKLLHDIEDDERAERHRKEDEERAERHRKEDEERAELHREMEEKLKSYKRQLEVLETKSKELRDGELSEDVQDGASEDLADNNGPRNDIGGIGGV